MENYNSKHTGTEVDAAITTVQDYVETYKAKIEFLSDVNSAIQGQIDSKQVAGSYVKTTSDQTVSGKKTFTDAQRFQSAMLFYPELVESADTPYSVTENDNIILVDTSGGAIELDLPNAASNAHMRVIVKDKGNAGTNNITINGDVTVLYTDTIDGVSTVTMNIDYMSITLYCDGNEWFLI